MTQAALPLAGMTVVDATRVLAGPYCTYLLALLGARVLRVERPGGDTIRWRKRAHAELGAAGLSTDYLAQAGNKEVHYLDLSRPEGRQAFLGLVARADVLVENFRGGALARLGLDERDIKARHPGLIWCAISGYGRAGPRSAFGAYDNVIQAASGIMRLTGDAESGPMKVGAPVIDYATGMNAALGVLSAWILRQRGTQGPGVEVSMLDTALALMQSTVTGHLNGRESLEGRGNRASSGNPLSRCYDAADGRVCIAINEPQQRRGLLAVLRLDPSAADRDAEPLLAVVQTMVRGWKAAELDAALNEAGVPCARVQTLDQGLEAALAADPGLVQAVGSHPSLRVMGLPFRLCGRRGETASLPDYPG